LLVEKALKVQGNPPLRDGWAKIFQIDANDSATLLRRLSRVYELPVRLRQELGESEIKPELYEGTLRTIESSLQLNLTNNWKGFTDRYTGETLSVLRWSDDALSKKAPPPILDEEKTAELEQEVEQLLKEVEESSLDESLKGFLLRQLHRIQNGLADYRVEGRVALVEAMQSVAGDAVFEPEKVRETQKAPAGRKVWKWMHGFRVAIHLVASASQIAAGGIPFLEAGVELESEAEESSRLPRIRKT